jgi:hypothetical protein
MIVGGPNESIEITLSITTALSQMPYRWGRKDKDKGAGCGPLIKIVKLQVISRLPVAFHRLQGVFRLKFPFDTLLLAPRHRALSLGGRSAGNWAKAISTNYERGSGPDAGGRPRLIFDSVQRTYHIAPEKGGRVGAVKAKPIREAIEVELSSPSKWQRIFRARPVPKQGSMA